MADSTSTSGSPLTPVPVAVFRKRGAKVKTLRKRAATPPPAGDSSESDNYSSSEDETGQRVKRRKIASQGAVKASSRDSAATANKDISSATTFEADRSLALDKSNDAAKTTNWFDEDAEGAMASRNLLGSTRNRLQKTTASPSGSEPDGTYKGLANQTSYIQKNPNAPKRTVGPVKAPTNIRTVTITDMAPDVCKDYKRSGFCGFGDSCKFLHARENYLEGWQLDQEWDTVTKGKKNIAGTVVASVERRRLDEEENLEDEEAMLQNIPFVCIICEEDYKMPIMTRCGHYFCEPCALKRYRKDPSCAACGAGTNGVFNTAKRLQKLLDKKRERAERKSRLEEEEGMGEGQPQENM